MKTLTMKRDRSIAKDQKKLEEMKRKLHTDDECMSIMYLSIAVLFPVKLLGFRIVTFRYKSDFYHI